MSKRKADDDVVTPPKSKSGKQEPPPSPELLAKLEDTLMAVCKERGEAKTC